MPPNERIVNVSLRDNPSENMKRVLQGTVPVHIEIVNDPVGVLRQKFSQPIPVTLAPDFSTIDAGIRGIEAKLVQAADTFSARIASGLEQAFQNAFSQAQQELNGLPRGSTPAPQNAPSPPSHAPNTPSQPNAASEQLRRLNQLQVVRVEGDARRVASAATAAFIKGVDLQRAGADTPTQIQLADYLRTLTRLTPSGSARGGSSGGSGVPRSEGSSAPATSRADREAVAIQRAFGGRPTEDQANQLIVSGVPEEIVRSAQTRDLSARQITAQVVRNQKLVDAKRRLDEKRDEEARRDEEAQAAKLQKEEADEKERREAQLTRDARRFRGSKIDEQTFLAAGGSQDVVNRAKGLPVTTAEILKSLTGSKSGGSTAAALRLQKRIELAEKEYDEPGIKEFITSILGGERARQKVRDVRRSQIVEKYSDIPGLDKRLAQRAPESLFRPGNIKDPATLHQIGFASVYGGLPGGLAATAAALTPFGKGGALFASTLQQGLGNILEQIIEPFRKHQEEFQQAGMVFSRSILGIASVLQATSTVVDSTGSALGNRNISAQINYQESRAEQIQLAARAKLLPLGIAGSTESTFVQGITSALAQRGISADSGQIATISERLGGVIRATRPQLLENTSLLNRDLQDVLSGLPQANRTVLGSIIRPSLSDLSSARSGADVVKALDRVSAFADTVKNSDNISAISDRIEGRQDFLNTTAGNKFYEQLKPGLKSFYGALSDESVASSYEKIGSALGSAAKVGLDFSTTMLKVGSTLTNVISPLGQFLAGLAPIAPAILGVVTALNVGKGLLPRVGALANQEKIFGLATGVASANGVASLGDKVLPFWRGASAEPENLIKAAPPKPSFLSKSLQGIGKVASFIPQAAAAYAALELIGQVPGALIDAHTEQVDRRTAVTRSAIERLQIAGAATKPQAMINTVLASTGEDEELKRAAAARDATVGQKLLSHDFARLAFGDTKAYQSESPEKDLRYAELLGQSYQGTLAAFAAGPEGDISKGNFHQGILNSQVSATRSAIESRRQAEADRQAKEGSPERRLSALNDDLSKAKIERDKLDRQMQMAGRKAAISGSDQDHDSLTNKTRDFVNAKARVKELEMESDKVRSAIAGGDPLHAKIVQQNIDDERKILEYRNQGVDSAQKTAQAYSQIAESAKGAFVLQSRGGLNSYFKTQTEYLTKAQAEFTKLPDQINTSRSEIGKQLLQAYSDREKENNNPTARIAIERHIVELKAQDESFAERQKTLPFDQQRAGLALLQAQTESRVQQASLPFDQRLVGVNRQTAAGGLLASQLEERKAKAELSALDKQISSTDDSDYLEKLKMDRSSKAVQVANAGQAVVDARFGQQEAIPQFQKALIDLSNMMRDEVARRTEVNDALRSSKTALEEFDRSLESRRMEQSGNMVFLARKIKDEGGYVGADIDTSDKAIKSQQLAIDVSKFNEMAQRSGLIGQAEGGNSQKLVSANSEFEQGLDIERNKLVDGVRRASEAFEKLPSDLDLFRLALQKAAADLGFKANGKAEPGNVGAGAKEVTASGIVPAAKRASTTGNAPAGAGAGASNPPIADGKTPNGLPVLFTPSAAAQAIAARAAGDRSSVVPSSSFSLTMAQPIEPTSTPFSEFSFERPRLRLPVPNVGDFSKIQTEGKPGEASQSAPHAAQATPAALSAALDRFTQQTNMVIAAMERAAAQGVDVKLDVNDLASAVSQSFGSLTQPS